MKETLNLPDLITNKSFSSFIRKLRKCSIVRAVCIIGGMVYRGWSDNDVDLWIQRYSDDYKDKDLDELIDPLPVIFEEVRGGCKILDGIPLDFWYCSDKDSKFGELDLNLPVLVLWSK